MKRTLLIAFVIFIGSNYRVNAADDGQTQPRLNYANNNSWSTYVDLVPTTNGAGNVKGIHCLLKSGASAEVTFSVNGGTAQNVVINSAYMPPIDATSTTGYSGWVPFNIRFTSSIRIQIRKYGLYGSEVACTASWALD